MKNNSYIKFKDKYDNPVDNARSKDRKKIKGIEQKGEGYQSHMYHTTDLGSVKSIKKEGLKTGKESKWGESGEATYFSDRPWNAIKWEIRHKLFTAPGPDIRRKGDIVDNKENVPIALLRVHETACKDWGYDEIGSTSQYGDSLSCENDIPPRFIEIKTKKGWSPLKWGGRF